jgi:hypothetical protein
MKFRTYSELSQISDFLERFNYLKIGSQVGVATFGYDRYLNQAFYNSTEWKHVRDQVITRDLGCDMALQGYEIHGKIYIHHMNPMTMQDIEESNPDILNPEYLVCVTHTTHNAIHYGDQNLLPHLPIERKPGDTKLW